MKIDVICFFMNMGEKKFECVVKRNLIFDYQILKYVECMLYEFVYGLIYYKVLKGLVLVVKQM